MKDNIFSGSGGSPRRSNESLLIRVPLFATGLIDNPESLRFVLMMLSMVWFVSGFFLMELKDQ
ncbi:MAG TPA: hypothetical protein DCE22_07235 [Verrucomicrobiales bacterium]|nr:hypothetical protein [Verrucomicrobiales bacterium]